MLWAAYSQVPSSVNPPHWYTSEHPSKENGGTGKINIVTSEDHWLSEWDQSYYIRISANEMNFVDKSSEFSPRNQFFKFIPSIWSYLRLIKLLKVIRIRYFQWWFPCVLTWIFVTSWSSSWIFWMTLSDTATVLADSSAPLCSPVQCWTVTWALMLLYVWDFSVQF